MTIRLAHGNLLHADVEALVNTVNCVGIMGKGIALQFKNTYPDMFTDYRHACDTGQVRPGVMHVWETGQFGNPQWVINFPTKRHYRDMSRLDDIRIGLVGLVADVKAHGITSIAIPPLGCGLGGLQWAQVEPLIVTAFTPLPHVDVHLYPPTGR
jgi:O-acetyl-ADP-ribose deacetylase (regulator of RNase III)